MKRIFDLVFALLGLIAASPLFLVIISFIKLDSPGSVFYRGERVGKEGKLFKVYKFRTMFSDAEKLGGPSTSDDDPRITKFGRFLRKYKLDELPEFINILRGEMSFVGPRPEVLSEVKTYDEETKRIILSVKPGLTDFASLWDIREGEILRGSKDPHQTYREKIGPEKIRLQLKYIKERSLLTDLKIIFLTLKKLL